MAKNEQSMTDEEFMEFLENQSMRNKVAEEAKSSAEARGGKRKKEPVKKKDKKKMKVSKKPDTKANTTFGGGLGGMEKHLRNRDKGLARFN